jgi:uncharacterized protein YgbK (DUF1537 family)
MTSLPEGAQAVALIADDLTGAMDSGLQFAQQGLDAVVMMERGATVAARTLVYTTESRELPPSQAVRRLQELLPLVGERLIYKKIDSTLRGNVGYELRVLAVLAAVRAIVVAPAFPQGGRTTLGGVQLVHDRPLALTEFRDDPRWPMRESHVPTLLMQQAGMEVGLVEHSIVAQGAQAVASELRRQAARIVVVDAASDADLAHIAQALHTLGPRWVPCGSAGLARPWAALLAEDVEPVTPESWPPLDRPALFVCGSRNPATLRQVEHLAAAGEPRIMLDALGSYDEDREATRLAGAVCEALGQGRDTLLEASTAPLLPGGGPRITRILARAALAAAQQQLLGGLFMTGGDVAIALCQQLGVRALRILAQIQPGLPGAQLIGGLCDGLPAATKAGGFGTDDALLDVQRWFAQVRQRDQRETV